MCDSCEYNKDYIYNNELELCKKCRDIKSNKLITKTNSKKQYFLNNKDIENVRHISYKGIHETYLYLLNDMENISINKWGSEKIIKEKLNQKEEKLNKKKQDKDFRKKELLEHLREIGLNNIRKDSSLCQDYIEKGENSGFDKYQIGEIMKEMKFYYEQTNYKKLLREQRYFEKKQFFDYYYDWTDEDEEDLRKQVKILALNKYVEINYMNHHKMENEIPISLKFNAMKYSRQLYEKNNIKKKTIKRDKFILQHMESVLKKIKNPI